MFALVMNHEFNDATEFSSFVLESLRLVQWDERIGVAVEDKCRGHVGGYVINGRHLMADDFPDGEVRGVRSEGFDETFGRAAIVHSCCASGFGCGGVDDSVDFGDAVC